MDKETCVALILLGVFLVVAGFVLVNLSPILIY